VAAYRLIGCRLRNQGGAAGHLTRGRRALLARSNTSKDARSSCCGKRSRSCAAARTPAAKLPADQIDPDARTAVLRAGRRGLQMVLRLLAHNAEHWLATHLNAYLRDDDEYRAITRETIIRGLAGVITFTPAAITVTLEPPGQPRVARALALLIDEINAQYGSRILLADKGVFGVAGEPGAFVEPS
jgi:hypothetical protein